MGVEVAWTKDEGGGEFHFQCETHQAPAKGYKLKNGKIILLSCESGCAPDILLTSLNGAVSKGRNSERGGAETTPSVKKDALPARSAPRPHDSKSDGLYAKLKAEIDRDGVSAYQALLSQTLRTKAGSREMFALCPFHSD